MAYERLGDGVESQSERQIQGHVAFGIHVVENRRKLLPVLQEEEEDDVFTLGANGLVEGVRRLGLRGWRERKGRRRTEIIKRDLSSVIYRA